jgi:hypothetical protein
MYVVIDKDKWTSWLAYAKGTQSDQGYQDGIGVCEAEIETLSLPLTEAPDHDMPRLGEWLDEVLPILLAHKARRMDGSVDIGEVSLYWVGPMLRLDIKPNTEASDATD